MCDILLYDEHLLPQRSIPVVYYPDGKWVGNPQAQEVRPALSLSKLHLGLWLSRHGNEH